MRYDRHCHTSVYDWWLVRYDIPLCGNERLSGFVIWTATIYTVWCPGHRLAYTSVSWFNLANLFIDGQGRCLIYCALYSREMLFLVDNRIIILSIGCTACKSPVPLRYDCPKCRHLPYWMPLLEAGTGVHTKPSFHLTAFPFSLFSYSPGCLPVTNRNVFYVGALSKI